MRQLVHTLQIADPNDRRSVWLDVSPRGRQLVEKIERGSTEHFDKLVGRMTAEREALATALRALVRLSREHVLEGRDRGIVAVRRVS